jgi:hypothetical protein
MDPISIAKQIEEKILILEDLRDEIRQAAEERAAAISSYDKQLASTITSMRLKGTPTTTIEKEAKGVVFQARLDMELAEGIYKAVISNINVVSAQLNGLQSINRHLSNL